MAIGAPQAAQAWMGNADEEFELNDLEASIPEGLPIPATYRMFVMPVGIQRSLKVKGTDKHIFLPDESVDAQTWLHSIGRIAALGPACFKHKKYKEEYGLRSENFPGVGDLILYSAHSPQRFQYRGVRLIVLNDDQWLGKIVDPETTGLFKFYV